MATTQTPADLQAALTRALSDPKVAGAAKAWTDFHAKNGVWNPGHGTMGPQTDFQNAIAPYLPSGYHAVMGQDGQPVLKKDGMPSWVYPLAAAAIGLTAGAASGAFAPVAAAGAGGGTTVGSALSLPTLTSMTGAPIVSVGMPTAASVAAPTVAGGSTVGSLLNFGSKVAAPKAGGGMGISISDIVKAAIPSAISGITGMVTASKQGAQADRALQAELDAQKYGTDAQSKSAADQLAFAREQEAARQREFREAQAKNFELYQQQQARLAPYRNLGSSAVSLFGKPITVGSALGV